METRNPPSSNWSDLPFDILLSLFERLSFVDFHRTKLVCSYWISCSKQIVPKKNVSPWLTLFPHGDNLGDSGCVLYNPDEDKVYRTERHFSTGTRFIANSGKWFLVLDSGSSLYITDVFTNNRVHLPPLESVLSSDGALKRVGDREFIWEFGDKGGFFKMVSTNMRGRLWVDHKAEEFVVVWFFYSLASFIFFCKKGNDHYNVIPLRDDIPKLLNCMNDLVLLGYRLYILTNRLRVRVIDLSGQKQGSFKYVTESDTYQKISHKKHASISIAVTLAGEVFLVESTTFENNTSFRIHKKDPNSDIYNVDSLGDEALLLDMGITVPANYALGIKPNSIYFTSHQRIHPQRPLDLDICVFNLATKTLDRFPALADMNLKDAQWFLPVN